MRRTVKDFVSYNYVVSNHSACILTYIMCYRILFGLDNVCVSDLFEINSASHTRGHTYKLHKPRSYNRVPASSFSNRVTNVCNSLPADRVDFFTFVSFTGTVERIVLHRFSV